MTKIILIAVAFAFSFTGFTNNYRMESICNQMLDIESLDAVPPAPIIISNIFMQEGTNTISVKANKGTITLLKKGDFFSNVIFTDNAGNTFRLMPKPGGSTTCAFPVPGACFGNDETAVINICRQTNTAAHTGPFSITIVPAIKKTKTP